ncbi:RNA polymerase sigma factor [Actinophytocola sp.]|uniref:RNA polymerase sigma factor n=1 Tax=Actinophytocola sp. TaxID=1872138 RepID=UPI002D80E5A8|nr:sigma-70 family RNA polymerase sigma factor [Actinophytocola sp.]HET9142231.1 sigma-70 family RNA polymerase sigma factor [Actinophytocola sp.]
MEKMTLPGVRAEPGGSIGDLYREQRLGLVRLAVLLLGDKQAAEDAVQDVFASLWSRRFHPDRDAYLRVAVVNRCRSHLRHRVRARNRHTPGDVPGPAPDERLALAEEHRQMLAAIDRLPGRQREVVVLRYYAELSLTEIAATLGIRTGTVKSTAARALTALRRFLEEEN